MDNNSLAHSKWNCKYHIVFAPKYTRQVIHKNKTETPGGYLREREDMVEISTVWGNIT